MTVSINDEEEVMQQAKEVVNENLILLESRYHAEPEECNESNASSVADDSPIYFRYLFLFNTQSCVQYKRISLMKLIRLLL